MRAHGDEIDSLAVVNQSANMNLFFYRIVLTLALPFVRIRLYLRARREPAYGERVAERFGGVPSDVSPGPIWFHTVSAGESIAAAPLIRAVATQFEGKPVLVTTMTPTGSGEVTARLSDVAQHCYAPYDFTFAVRRFFNQVKPSVLVLMETELWPNLIHEAHIRQVPVMCVNARLSERSAKGYAKLGTLTRQMLDEIDFIACQYDDHVHRFVELGADPQRIAALGSVKFDVQLPQALCDEAKPLRARLGGADRPVWIAASTHPGEDEIVLEAYRSIKTTRPEVLLVLVPRHPVRADEVVALASGQGFTAVRQSACEHHEDDHHEGDHHEEETDVIVGDVMGSLLQLYGVADVAFVAGSFVPVGGHNPIEPALWKIPVLSGPLQFNFPDVMAELQAAGGLYTVQDAAQLAETVLQLLNDDARRRAMGEAAHDFVVRNRGASGRLLELLQTQITAALAEKLPAQPGHSDR